MFARHMFVYFRIYVVFIADVTGSRLGKKMQKECIRSEDFLLFLPEFFHFFTVVSCKLKMYYHGRYGKITGNGTQDTADEECGK